MNIKKLRMFLWGVLGVVVAWILWMNVVPDGKIIYVNNFSDDYSEFVRKLTPDERVEPIEGGAQKIIGDPAYFDLRVPRHFTEATMTIKYKNNTALPIVEAGVLMDKKLWQYNLAPLQNKILDNLISSWQVLREDGLILLQRPGLPEEDIFSSIKDFKNNLPKQERIVLYNTDLNNEYILDDYKASSKEKDLGLSLRGAYQFYIYLKDEDLNFIFNFIDLNEYEGSDEVDINLYYQDQLINGLSLADDGIVDDKAKQGEEQTAELKLTNLPQGLYKVEVKTSDDIITSNIKTTQEKISFVNKVWLASTKNGINLFTDSLQISAQTINPNSLQTINVGEQDLILKNTYQQQNLMTSVGVKEVNLEKGGVKLSGNGVFALKDSDLINPQYRKIDGSINLESEQIDYVLARYSQPIEDGDYLISQVEFDLSNAYKEFSKHKFIFSIPGLHVEDGKDDYIEIDEIKIELEGTSLWEKILNIFE